VPAGLFVTNESTPRGFAAIAAKRIRNAMDDGFQTIKSGLFVQEFLSRGTVFGGRLHLHDPESNFGRQAGYIFRTIRPIINGALFQHSLAPWTPLPFGQENTPHLVIIPIPTGGIPPGSPDAEHPAHVKLTNHRRYSSILKRPRRNRVVIAPGSILPYPVEGATVAWQGFGKEITPPPTQPEPVADLQKERTSQMTISQELLHTFKKGVPTRSQAGLLRDFLHPGMTAEAIQSALAMRVEKYQEKQDTDRHNLFSTLLRVLEENGLEALVQTVRTGLEEVALNGQWAQRQEADQ
jgi:hypothetical protein